MVQKQQQQQQQQQQIQNQRLLEQQQQQQRRNLNYPAMGLVGLNHPVISLSTGNPLPLLGMTAQSINPTAISITPLPQSVANQQPPPPPPPVVQQGAGGTLSGILRSTLSQPPLNHKETSKENSVSPPSSTWHVPQISDIKTLSASSILSSLVRF